jgi:hypothetical protein
MYVTKESVGAVGKVSLVVCSFCAVIVISLVAGAIYYSKKHASTQNQLALIARKTEDIQKTIDQTEALGKAKPSTKYGVGTIQNLLESTAGKNGAAMIEFSPASDPAPYVPVNGTAPAGDWLQVPINARLQGSVKQVHKTIRTALAEGKYPVELDAVEIIPVAGTDTGEGIGVACSLNFRLILPNTIEEVR